MGYVSFLRQERNKEPVCGVKADWVELDGRKVGCVRAPRQGKT